MSRNKIIVLLFFLCFIFLPFHQTEAKTVKMNSNVCKTYREKYEMKKHPERLNELGRQVLSRTRQGKVGYVGIRCSLNDDPIIKIYRNIFNAGYFVELKPVLPGKRQSYYKLFYETPYRDDDLLLTDLIQNEESDLLWYIAPYDQKEKDRILSNKKTWNQYWKNAYRCARKAGVRNGMKDRIAVKKIAVWLCKHTKYRFGKRDNYKYGTLFKKGQGVCRDYADAFYAMCKVSGIPCKVCYGTVKGGGRHAWNKVKVGKKWYWIDVTWMDQGSRICNTYYLKRRLWKNHHKPYDVFEPKTISPADFSFGRWR